MFGLVIVVVFIPGPVNGTEVVDCSGGKRCHA